MSTTPRKADKAAPAKSKPRSRSRTDTSTNTRTASARKTNAKSPADPAEIKRDIDQTRDDLADTAEALAHKMDVPTRVKDKVHETAETVRSTAEQVTHQAHAKAQEALGKLPPPARERVEQLGTTARQRPLVTAALALVVGVMLGRLSRRTRS